MWDLSGQIHSALDHPLCIEGYTSGNTRPITLQPCSGSDVQLWVRNGLRIDQQARPDRAIEIFRDERRHGNMFVDGRTSCCPGRTEFLHSVRDLLAEVNAQADETFTFPIRGGSAEHQLERLRHTVAQLQPPYPNQVAPPVIDTFPGVVPADAPRVTETVVIDRNETRAPHLRVRINAPHTASTGLYAVAGEPFVVDFGAATAADLADITVIVGPNYHGWTEFARHEYLLYHFSGLQPGPNEFRSYYGGQIYIASNATANESLSATFSGVVRMPYFVVGETSLEDWQNTIRHYPAPLAELESDNVILTFTSDAVRVIDDPNAAMAEMSQLIALNNKFMGVEEGAALPHAAATLPQRMAFDEQLNAPHEATGRSGYPATFDENRFMTRVSYMTQHEMGHNFQQTVWMNAIAQESTADLIAWHARETMGPFNHYQGIVARRFPGKADDNGLLARLESGTAKYDEFGGGQLSQRLVMMLQLRHAFPWGWDTFYRINRQYREIPQAEFDTLNNASSKVRREEFYKQASIATCHDLRDFMTCWGVTLSQPILDEVAALGLPEPSAANPPWRVTEDSLPTSNDPSVTTCG